MNQSFIQLWALQQLDSEMKTLTTKLEQIPARLSELKRTTETMKSDLESARQGITEHKKQYKLAEVDLKAAEEKINGYSVQLYSAKTNEQYKAFLKEIETQKKLKSSIEDRMIVLMEETEALDRKVRDYERKSADLEVETARRLRMLEDEQKELAAAIEVRAGQRKTIVESLPDDMLKRYERVQARKGGIAVATARKDRCTGCLSPIPAQRVLEIERQDRLYICEACGRILIASSE